MSDRTLEILLLCDRPRNIAATLHHHIGALSGMSRHRVRVLPILGDLPKSLDLDRFDVVVIHWSLVFSSETYVSSAARAQIAAFQGLKVAFIQDEYRFIDRTVAAFHDAGIHVLFTCVPEEEIEKVYPAAKLPGMLVKVNTLTGYVDDSLLGLDCPALQDRRIDVGYRARKVPAWLGALGQEKYVIGELFRKTAPEWGLNVDISSREEDRLYGDGWTRFLLDCKAVLGVESGASVFDFDGSIQAACEADIRVDPEVDFETLRDRHFKDKDGLIRLNQISPRCFEAAALKTLMILYEGDYSGRLTPWRHYVPLKKDHSNMAEVVAALRDEGRAQQIVDTAYSEVACNPENSFAHFVAQFDQVVTEALARLGRSPAAPYDDAQFAAVARPSFSTRRRRVQRIILNGIHKIIFGYLLASASETTRVRAHMVLRSVLQLVRVVLRRGTAGSEDKTAGQRTT